MVIIAVFVAAGNLFGCMLLRSVDTSTTGRIETEEMHGYWERRIKGKEDIGDHKWQQPHSFSIPHFHSSSFCTHKKESDFLKKMTLKEHDKELDEKMIVLVCTDVLIMLRSTIRGTRTHDHVVKSHALYQLS
nr:putative Myb family transcription factor At1g14600 [Tanacetum cinerariifolium]